MRAFVGCSSYDDIDPSYFEEAHKISESLINNNYDLIFGCCIDGLMGSVYNDFKNANKDIKAICTEHFKEDLDRVDCDKLLVKDTAEQLTELMKSDLIVFLPGGYGTYAEVFYMINAYAVNYHKSKIILVNTTGYYSPVIEILNTIKEERFAKVFDFVYVVNTIEEFNALLGEKKCLSMEKM